MRGAIAPTKHVLDAPGTAPFGNIAILAEAMLDAIAACIINGNHEQAGHRALFGAAASQVSIVHGTEFEFGAAPGAAIGYLLMALLCAFRACRAKPATPVQRDEADASAHR